MNDELRARLASLEAERLRPTPPKPPASPSALAEVVFRGIEDVLVADVDGVLGVEPALSRPGPPDEDHPVEPVLSRPGHPQDQTSKESSDG